MNLKSTFLAVVSTLLMASCATDPCIDVTCLNASTCSDGTCLCTDWYEGTDCGIEQRTKFLGTYSGNVVFTYSDSTTESDTWDITIGSVLDSVNHFDLMITDPGDTTGLGGIKGKLITNAAGDVTFDPQVIQDPDGDFSIQGTGFFTITQTYSEFSFEWTVNADGETITTSYTGTK
jgi:hypothetical protein|tara:strand:- start:1369 stop:1896 length:528 start_codon:yes stop_codon:yes gene_type:complete